MRLIQETHIKFMSQRRFAFVLSAVVILAGLGSLIIQGGPKLSIDFKGGTMVAVSYREEVNITKVRSSLATMTIEGQTFDLSKEEINQLMKVIPLYCYFPRSEWKEISLAEIDDENGNAILAHYSKIYSENFLKDNQNDSKIFIEGTGGCRSNPKDSFWLSPARLTKQEISMLRV